jgi:anthranilate/para-aminobenzoate synthase component I
MMMQLDGLPTAELMWLEPLEAARIYTRNTDPFALLLSGSAPADGREHCSYLALGMHHITSSGTLDDWRWQHHHHALPAFGYLGYECWQQMESLNLSPAQNQAPSFIPLPLLWWLQPRSLLVFHHARKELICYGEIPLAYPTAEAERPISPVMALGSSLPHARYLASATRILEDIQAGEYYQANLTRKIYGLWREAPSPLDVFASLTRISPAPYSALINSSEWAIASSSMEQLLAALPDGTISSKPIKGSIRRGEDAGADATLRRQLAESSKDQAENLMIVDLVRNDLAQLATPGSVQVPALHAVESYAQIHHLVSTITATRAEDTSLREIILSLMPPGSMTGAPKRAAIARLAQLESQQRGAYAGALGWLQQETAELSVVIRTLVMEGERFEFQVGGGIVADSDPQAEWQESLLKARGIARLLGLSETQLASI